MSYASRLAAASKRARKASAVFEALENDFLVAAQDARAVHDDLQAEIDRLVELREQALNEGLHNEERAKRVRETFL